MVWRTQAMLGAVVVLALSSSAAAVDAQWSMGDLFDFGKTFSAGAAVTASANASGAAGANGSSPAAAGNASPGSAPAPASNSSVPSVGNSSVPSVGNSSVPSVGNASVPGVNGSRKWLRTRHGLASYTSGRAWQRLACSLSLPFREHARVPCAQPPYEIVTRLLRDCYLPAPSPCEL
jgi:hypothetical protein